MAESQRAPLLFLLHYDMYIGTMVYQLSTAVQGEEHFSEEEKNTYSA